MRTNAWRNLGSAALLAALLLGADGQSRAGAQTTGTLREFGVRLIRQSERDIIPATGRDRWVMRAELALPTDFDPNRKAVEISVTAPCPECEGSPGGAFVDPAKHISTLRVQQLLLLRGGAWSMKVFDDPDNGKCVVTLRPRARHWVLRARCRGLQVLPEFLDTLDFVLRVSIGENVFTSSVTRFKQMKATVRRYE